MDTSLLAFLEIGLWEMTSQQVVLFRTTALLISSVGTMLDTVAIEIFQEEAAKKEVKRL